MLSIFQVEVLEDIEQPIIDAGEGIELTCNIETYELEGTVEGTKKALVNDGIVPWIIKGRAEKAEMITQPKQAIKRPSFSSRMSLFRNPLFKGRPTAIIIMAEIKRAFASPSP